MSRRRNKVRQKARRARKREEQEAEEKAAEELRRNPTPVNHSRLRQYFSTLSFRSNVRGGTRPFAGYVLGPNVVASNPKELEAEMNNVYVEAVVGKLEN